LSGNGARTPEEEEIAAKFGGKDAELFAREAISLHRKSQTLTELSGRGELSEKEKKYATMFQGKNADLLSRMAIGYQRKSRLLQHLSGEEDDLDIEQE